ncbi:MAG: dual specificity protein phosphatase family protein [Pseudomonadota bacterium]
MHQIYRVKTNVSGQLHLMPAPPSAQLHSVCQALAERNVHKLVSLLTDEDIAALDLTGEPAAAEAQGIEFIHFPIVDFGLPDPDEFRPEVARLCDALRAGENIAIHCRAGIGRTGTLASCILKGLGLPSDEAMARVAAARGTSIPDTDVQRQFITGFQLYR